MFCASPATKVWKFLYQCVTFPDHVVHYNIYDLTPIYLGKV